MVVETSITAISRMKNPFNLCTEFFFTSVQSIYILTLSTVLSCCDSLLYPFTCTYISSSLLLSLYLSSFILSVTFHFSFLRCLIFNALFILFMTRFLYAITQYQFHFYYIFNFIFILLFL